jgi:hypothetical protein
VNIKRKLISTFLGTLLQGESLSSTTPRMMVAAYFSPLDLQRWSAIVEASKRVPLTVIVSPDLNKYTNVDWLNVFDFLKCSSVQVVGNISMDFGNYRSSRFLEKASIYLQDFALNGLYLDDVPTSQSDTPSYWSDVIDYLNSIDPTIKPLLVCNFDQHGNILGAHGTDVIVQYHSNAIEHLDGSSWNHARPTIDADRLRIISDPIHAYSKLLARSFTQHHS